MVNAQSRDEAFLLYKLFQDFNK